MWYRPGPCGRSGAARSRADNVAPPGPSSRSGVARSRSSSPQPVAVGSAAGRPRWALTRRDWKCWRASSARRFGRRGALLLSRVRRSGCWPERQERGPPAGRAVAIRPRGANCNALGALGTGPERCNEGGSLRLGSLHRRARPAAGWNIFPYSRLVWSESIPADRRRIRRLWAGARSCGPGPPVYDCRGRGAPSPWHRLGYCVDGGAGRTKFD